MVKRIQQNKETELKKMDFSRKEKLSAYFYDLSKLSFGGVVIGSGLAWVKDFDNPDYLIALFVGAYLTFGFAFVANRIMSNYIKSY